MTRRATAATPRVHPEAWRASLPAFAHRVSGGTWEPYSYLVWLAAEIERAVVQGGGRLILNMPPRHGKSEMISRWLPAWFLEWWPHKRVILGCYGDDLANGHSRFVRDQFKQNPLFTAKVRADKDAAGEWLLDNCDKRGRPIRGGGGMLAASTGTGITGRGGDLIILDDPYKDWADAHSAASQRHLTDWWQSTLVTRAEPGATIIVVHTRWRQDDLTGWLLSQPGGDRWRHLRLPALAEANDPLGREPGQALCPRRFDAEHLAFKRDLEVGPYMFAGMYQQSPSPAKGQIWLRDEIRHYTAASLPSTFDSQVQSWDLTFGSTGDGASYVVGQVWGLKGNDKYLLDQMRFKGSFPQQIDAVQTLAAKWPDARPILIEEKASGKPLIDTLQKHIGGLRPVRPDGSKLDRAHAVSVDFRAGLVHVPAVDSVPWVAALLNEWITFPNAASDDQVDAATQALQHFALPRPHPFIVQWF